MTTKEKILQSALQLFLIHGYDRVSISDIVKRADVSKGALYNYFSSKKELFLQALLQAFRDFDDSITVDFKQKSFDSFHEFYLAFAERYDRLLNDKQSYLSGMMVLMIDSASTFPELSRAVDNYELLFCSFWCDNIRNAVDSGELQAALPVEQLSNIYLDLVNGVLIDAAAKKSHDQATHVLRNKFDTIYALLKKEK